MKPKTHKATIKRVKVTKSGKFLKLQSSRSHLLSHKSNRLKILVEINRADIKKVKKLLPGT